MKTAVEEAGIGTLALLLALVTIAAASLSLLRSLHFIFSGRDGRMQRAKQTARVSIRRIIFTVVLLATSGYAWNYWKSAHLRSFCEPKDRNSEYSADGHYLARYCYFKDTIVLRLYDKDGTQLLAERTYRDPSGVPVELYWKKGALLYPEEHDLGTIRLPPSLYDRILAKLP
jgi:hypothetical protein